MNIKISGLRSGLNYNDMLNPITGGFIEDIEKKLGCSIALLNDDGLTATCEGDIAALITMHIVRLLTGQPSFQANPSRISSGVRP